MAARGTRNLDAGEEKMEDEKMVERLRSTSRRINRRALITAAIITLVTIAFP